MQRDAKGLLWLGFVVNDSGDPLPRVVPGIGDVNEIFCTVIEVIGLDRMRVVTSARFDDVVTGFVADRTLMSLRELDDGLVVMDISQLDIVGW